MSLDSYIHWQRPPAEGQPTEGQPLVFAFHGTGGDETQFLSFLAATLPGAGIVAPRGDVQEHGANRYFRRRAEGVYDMADLTLRTAKMEGFIRAHAARHPASPLVGLGYSNGANILASVVLKAPDLFARAVLMHPLIPWAPGPDPRLAGLELMVTAGRHDPICPWPQSEALIRHFRAQGAEVAVSLQPGGHEVPEAELQDVQAFLRRPLAPGARAGEPARAGNEAGAQPGPGPLRSV